MKKVLIILLLLSNNVFSSNSEQGEIFQVDDQSFVITLKAKRKNMAHDPISFIFGGSHEVRAIIKSPSNTGKVKAEKLDVSLEYEGVSEPNKMKYLQGFIVFERNKLLVKMKHVFNDNETPESDFQFNGEYKLATNIQKPNE